ncbi:MAG: hypothetical protein J2O39_03025 [Acidimicrobiales bacterium]|nr:hypothetical protein [Acidimicrobiales bacterium]
MPPTMAHPARDMVVIAEWAVPLFRIAIIAMTPLQLMRTGPIKFLVAALVAINAVMLYLGWRRRGPYSRGRPGIVFDLLFALLSMTLFVVLLPTRTYAQMLPNSPLPLANYLAPCAAALAVWTAPRPQAGHLRALHRLRDIVLVGTLLPLLAGFCLLNGYHPSELRWAALTMQVVPTWIALFVGYAIARIAVDFATAQANLIRAQTEERLDAVEHEHNRHFDWLHSRVLPVLGTIGLHLESGRISVSEAATAARDVDFAIRNKRHRDLLNDRSVRLADIVSFYMRFSNPQRDHAGRPVAGAALGGVTLDGETAHLVDRTLGGLVSNASKYAGPDRWSFHVTRRDGRIVVRVEDEGPGFSDRWLTQPGSSLSDLRCSLEAAGGTLTRLAPLSGSGTVMIASIPEESNGSDPAG